MTSEDLRRPLTISDHHLSASLVRYQPSAEFSAMKEQYHHAKEQRKQERHAHASPGFGADGSFSGSSAGHATYYAHDAAAAEAAASLSLVPLGKTRDSSHLYAQHGDADYPEGDAVLLVTTIEENAAAARAAAAATAEGHPYGHANGYAYEHDERERRKRGRPKGSKNKPKDPNAPLKPKALIGPDGQPLPKRKPGRPKGSKSRTKGDGAEGSAVVSALGPECAAAAALTTALTQPFPGAYASAYASGYGGSYSATYASGGYSGFVQTGGATSAAADADGNGDAAHLLSSFGGGSNGGYGYVAAPPTEAPAHAPPSSSSVARIMRTVGVGGGGGGGGGSGGRGGCSSAVAAVGGSGGFVTSSGGMRMGCDDVGRATAAPSAGLPARAPPPATAQRHDPHDDEAAAHSLSSLYGFLQGD